MRQGVLSPILFSDYIDDIICVLRNSGYGVYIGSVFIGCILYADDIVREQVLLLFPLRSAV